jgi:hypothetical protein
VQSYIDEQGFHLSYDEENQWFSGGSSLDSVLESCEVTVYIFEDMVAVAAEPDLAVPEENMANMALFQAMINNNLFYSHFNFDVEWGGIESFTSLIAENSFPTAAEIEMLISDAVLTLNKYGDYLNQVALGADPYETYQAHQTAKY